MIRTVTGKPGGSKTYYGVRDIIEELRFGNRCVCTNAPLVLSELNAYLQAIDPRGPAIELTERVRMLSDEETKDFYAHRQPGCDFEVPTDEETKKGKRVDYGVGDDLVPILYIIDEAHLFFDAHRWMSAGPHLTYYNSQHRKLGDEVMFITQFLALLDKRCKGFSQEFIECTNYGLIRMLMFRGPIGQFQAVSRLTDNPNAPSTHTEYYRLDPKIAKCYSTTAGQGIRAGRDAKPREKRQKGLSIFWATPVIVGALALLIYVPDLIGAAIIKGTDGMSQKVGQGVSQIGAPSVQPPAGPVQPPIYQLPPAPSFAPGEMAPVMPQQPQQSAPYSSAVSAPKPVPAPVFVRGWVRMGERFQVVLSDGRVLGDEDGGIRAVRRNFVDLSTGERIWFVRPRSGPPIGEIAKRTEIGVPGNASGVLRDSVTDQLSGTAAAETPPK